MATIKYSYEGDLVESGRRMDGPDYPVEHFSLMKGLAVELKEIGAQILRHGYSYEGFGSWWMTIDRRGKVFRLAFDGRDDTYSIEEGAERQESSEPRDPMWQAAGTAHELPIAAILAILRDRANLMPE